MGDYDFSELAALIEINSYTRNKAGVDEVTQRYSSHMRALGYQVKLHPREDIGDHVHYVSPKKNGTKILALGHFDTVFPPGTFTEFSQDDAWIYGPGVCDMKGGNHVLLEALRNIKAQFGAIHNIDVLMVSDEETGSDDSKHLTVELAKDYDFCMVFEAAGVNQDVVIARKGIATYHIELEGKAAHAGNHYSEGADANLAAAHMLVSLVALTDIEKGTTVNAGKIQGGIGANTVSPKAKLIVEARFTQQSERDRVLAAFAEICAHPKVEGVRAFVNGGLQRDVMQPSDTQREFIRHIESVLGQNLVLEHRGGVSDANVTASAGLATIDGFGPYGDGDHTVRERACKKSYLQRIDDVTKILGSIL